MCRESNKLFRGAGGRVLRVKKAVTIYDFDLAGQVKLIRRARDMYNKNLSIQDELINSLLRKGSIKFDDLNFF